MRKFQKFVLGTVGAFMLGVVAPYASAGDCYSYWNPCNWRILQTEVGIGAEFLWWKPCVDDLDVAAIATIQDDTRVIDYQSLCPDWEPGFCVFMEFPRLVCNWDVAVSYTRLTSTATGSQYFENSTMDAGIVSPLLFVGGYFSNFSTFEFGAQKWTLNYNDWDLLLSHDFCWDPRVHFIPYFGIAGVYIEQTLEAAFLGSPEAFDAFIKWDSHFWAVGLRAGSIIEYDLGCGLSLFANTQASLLAGEKSAKNQQLQVEVSDEWADMNYICFEDDGGCQFVPGYHIGAGISYAGCWCNWDFGLKLGYEFVYWWNVPNQRVYFGEDTDGEIAHATSGTTRSLAFQGLVAGAWLRF